MYMLRDRFLSADLRTPSNQTLVQAFERAATAYSEAVNHRSDMALEVAHRACGQESSLGQMDKSKMASELEVA